MEFFLFIVRTCYITAFFAGVNTFDTLKYNEKLALLKSAEQEIKMDAESRIMSKVTALLMTNLLNDEPEPVKYRVANCISLSTSKWTYYRCVEPLLSQFRRQNFTTRHRRKRETYDQIHKEKFTLLDEAVPNKPVKSENIFEAVGQMLLNVVKNVKQKIGNIWYKDAGANEDDSNDVEEDVTQIASDINKILETFMKSPLISLKKNFDIDANKIALDQRSLENIDFQNQSRILSPRILPLFDDVQDEISFLSPDILSLYPKSEKPLSLANLLKNSSKASKRVWFEAMKEITGVGDIFRMMKSGDLIKLKKSQIRTNAGAILPVESVYDVHADKKIEDVYEMLTNKQMDELNDEGFTFMNHNQLKRLHENNTDRSEVDDQRIVTKTENYAYLIDSIQKYLTENVRNRRKKRQPSATCILSASITGATSPYLLQPQILCPSIFSYIILGPLVLSPYILSPYVFGPFILSPQVLTPFILNPYVLSPDILVPFVLSPSILSPYVLSPNILDPMVLSPSVLSPTVLSPNILSPGVLTPSIMSSGSLSPAILSPCTLCRKRRRRWTTKNAMRYRWFWKKRGVPL